LKLPLGKYKRDVEASFGDVEESLGNWAKGQLILMLVVGLTSTIGLVIVGGGQYAISLGLLWLIIPMVGPCNCISRLRSLLLKHWQLLVYLYSSSNLSQISSAEGNAKRYQALVR
jgi:predicted PurR-regulated permease PerM